MLGMSIVSPIIPLYAKSFGVTLAVASLAITANAFGRFVSDIPAGAAADRWGRRPVMIVGSVLIMVMALLNATATGFPEFLLYRFLQGVGSGMWMTARQTLLADILKPEERGRVMGYFQAFMLLGQSAGPTLGGWAAVAWGLTAPFYAFAVTGFACVVLTYFMIHEPAGAAKRVRHEEMFNPRDMWRLLRNQTYAMACLATFIVFFQRSGIRTNMIPIYAADELGMDPGAIGTILSYATLTNLLMTVPMGYAIDLVGRKPVIVWNILVMAVANVSFVYARDYWGMTVAALVLGVASAGAGQAPLALATDATLHERRGLAMGVYRLIGDVGMMIGPVALSLIADTTDLHAPFWVMTGMLVVNAVLVAVFAKEIIKTRFNKGGAALSQP
ncbi:MAG: MFS transporter [Candidatus Bathyarchaeota archaeon]|nr:MFS transporter [Candidatus Bathyarchaeota archaeon]